MKQEKKRVVILATGGTIAGSGNPGESIGYKSGTLQVESILDSIPAIQKYAEIEAIQICNVNSDDIGSTIWINLAKEIEKQALRPDVTGIVVTHGTDTLEETAFFLNLVLDTEKPVVLTGSMRPATAISADGPMNLYEAIQTALEPESQNRGVLVQFAGKLYSARDVQKSDAHALCAMTGATTGACGTVCDGKVDYIWKSSKPHTSETEFSISSISSLPKVTVLYFNADADPELIKAAESISDGLVIAGAGAGEFSLSFAEAINQTEIPVVVSSRIANGRVEQATLICPKTIAAGDLSPQKAAILLRLALTKGSSRYEIKRMFETY